jgi:hypothetical protein
MEKVSRDVDVLDPPVGEVCLPVEEDAPCDGNPLVIELEAQRVVLEVERQEDRRKARSVSAETAK